MARRAVTRELYDALVAGFREAPGNYAFAARKAGCESRMAKRGWHIGWTDQLVWAVAISQVLQQEKEEARVRMMQEQEKLNAQAAAERQKARNEAIEGYAQEGQAIRVLRGASLQLSVAMVKLAPAVDACATELKRVLLDIAQKSQAGTGTQMDPSEMTKTLAIVGRTMKYAAEVSQQVMEMERLHLGEPQKVIGVDVKEAEQWTVEEALREIDEASEDATRIKANLRLVQPPEVRKEAG